MFICRYLLSCNNHLIIYELCAGAIPPVRALRERGVDTGRYPYKWFALTALFSYSIKSVPRTPTLQL